MNEIPIFYLVPLPVVAGPIPVVATQATVAAQAGRRYIGQRVPGLTQAPNLNKRARTALHQSDRDGTVGHATTLDGTGNPIQIKQEMKLDGENAYEHAAAAASHKEKPSNHKREKSGDANSRNEKQDEDGAGDDATPPDNTRHGLGVRDGEPASGQNEPGDQADAEN